jgi:hypothetical protein
VAIYEVWATNEVDQWTTCVLETDDRDEAIEAAETHRIHSGYRFIALDRLGKTIWTNDLDTPIED